MSAATGRRLSKPRVLLALVALAGIGAASFWGFSSWSDARPVDSADPWFAGYVDVTATPAYAFEQPRGDSGRDVVLSFIVADSDDECTPSWGTHYTLDEASAGLDLDRRIARLQQQGGGVAVSFGGLINDELATVCSSPDDLKQAYRDVVERYDVTTIDLDIEGDDLADRVAGERRAVAIAELQQEQRKAGDELAVWLTLPVATFGMTEEGTDLVAEMLDAGVDVAGVNGMTMNFGASMETGESMAEASERALQATHRQLGVLYEQAELPLSEGTLWRKVGATPMIGQNDNAGEVFTLADARDLASWAAEQGVGRMSAWSINRDQTCGPNYVDVEVVSDACSGIVQGETLFSDALSDGFEGDAFAAASIVTSSEPVDPRSLVDDPKTSPYPIWEEESSYLQGTKVVWHRSVYEAKWWTRGELPDDPVLDTWATPWELVGPVLEGEKPIEVPTLPSGTYPEWSGSAVFDSGDRVMFDGVPFEAKWWTEGDSPEASSSDPDSSPWVPLTTVEIQEVLNDE